jgi:hypothetical protein
MDLVTSLKCSGVYHMRMTDNHAFIKHNYGGEWTIMSFKNTHYLRSHECKMKLTERAGLQYIISNQKLKDVFAIYAPSSDPSNKN